MGKYSNVEERTSADDCKKCPLGRIGQNSGLGMIDNCDLCGAGSYTSETGGVTGSCKKCPLGRYSDSLALNQATCIECGKGRFVATTGTTTFNNGCKECPRGRYSDQTVNPINECKECGKGKFTLNGRSDKTSDCKTCAKGKYNDAKSLEENSCKQCPTGRWGSTFGMISSGLIGSETSALGESCIACKSYFFLFLMNFFIKRTHTQYHTHLCFFLYNY